MLFLLDAFWAASALGLIALSLGLIFGELKVVNLAQGELLMVGAYGMYTLRDLPFMLALLLTVAFGLVLGVVLERGVISRVYDRGFVATLLATFGVGVVLQQTAASLFSATARGVDPPLRGSVSLLGTDYPAYRLAAASGACLLIAAVLVLVFRTPLGLRLRASIDNVEMASILGTSPRRMFTLVFAIASALGVCAGALLAPTIALTPGMGLSYLGPAFFAVLIARQGSLSGAVLGGVSVAVVTTLLSRLLDLTVAQVVLFGLLALLIAVKPQGISWGPLRRLARWNFRLRPTTTEVRS